MYNFFKIESLYKAICNGLSHRYMIVLISILFWVFLANPYVNDAAAQIGLLSQDIRTSVSRQGEVVKASTPKANNIAVWSRERSLPPQILDQYIDVFAVAKIRVKPKTQLPYEDIDGLAKLAKVQETTKSVSDQVVANHYSAENGSNNGLDNGSGNISGNILVKTEGEVEIVPSLNFSESETIKQVAFKDGAFPDLITIRQNIPRDEFLNQEKTLQEILLSSQGQNKIEAQKQLINLYLAYGFIPEALSIVRRDEIVIDQSITQFMYFSMGRYNDSLGKEKNIKKLPLYAINLKAMAHARLGRFEDAKPYFLNYDLDLSLPRSDHAQYYVLKGQTLIETGHYESAYDALLKIDDYDDIDGILDQKIFWNELLATHRGLLNGGLTLEQGIDNFTHLSRLPVPFKNMALLERTKLEIEAETLSPAEALDLIKPLSLQWSGGHLGRQLQLTSAKLYHQNADHSLAFDLYRDIVTSFEESDIAHKAEEGLQSLFASLFEQTDGVDLLNSTQLLYENIDLLKPGEEGDAQIRHLTQRLTNLDLLAEASELLEHQVFQRLRGAERAQVAIDLGTVYLENLQPLEALRVIRSTRITGLSDGVVDQRRYIEAKALWKSGQHDKALSRLATDRKQGLNKQTRLLKADIAFSMGDYENAAMLMYPEVITLLSGHDQPYTKQDEIFVLQTITTLVQINDHQSIQLIQNLIADKFESESFTQIIKSLNSDIPPKEFLAAYQKWVFDNSVNASKS